MNARRILTTAFLALCKEEISGFEPWMAAGAEVWDDGEAEAWLTQIANGPYYLSWSNNGEYYTPCIREEF